MHTAALQWMHVLSPCRSLGTVISCGLSESSFPENPCQMLQSHLSHQCLQSLTFMEEFILDCHLPHQVNFNVRSAERFLLSSKNLEWILCLTILSVLCCANSASSRVSAINTKPTNFLIIQFISKRLYLWQWRERPCSTNSSTYNMLHT